jgi:tartrate-resistant acid phosphatase type 5
MNPQMVMMKQSHLAARNSRWRDFFMNLWIFFVASLFLVGLPGSLQASSVTFAVIGDYGMGDANEAAVANMVSSWNPDFIIAAGDDYYSPAGGTGLNRYDQSTGKFFCSYLKGVTTDSGAVCPEGKARVNRFFPVLGNHDYSDTGNPGTLPNVYTSYFALPGAGVPSTETSDNERYYDVIQGPVHFFMLNSANKEPPSTAEEPDGIDSASRQATWLRNQLAASTAPWKVVVIHKPPFSSDNRHGSTSFTQWPYAAWGANVVIGGHAHTYERIVRDGIVYFVNGLGGAAKYGFGTPVEGSAFRYSSNWGAMKVTANDTAMHLEFRSIDDGGQGMLQDQYDLPPREK